MILVTKYISDNIQRKMPRRYTECDVIYDMVECNIWVSTNMTIGPIIKQIIDGDYHLLSHNKLRVHALPYHPPKRGLAGRIIKHFKYTLRSLNIWAGSCTS